MGVSLILSEQEIVMGCVFIGIALIYIAYFSRQLNVSNKRISLFLDTIKDEEGMLFFEDKGNSQQQLLNKDFNQVNELLAKIKIDLNIFSASSVIRYGGDKNQLSQVFINFLKNAI